ncbi:hypothetical protein GLOIN_2v1678071 [Rhizophagus irregularis DAOM 181602=DAOM 197198]|nr:hypothetical protein GLOIN_2v1678071 [Rhizophagus irregularis DAOM 181602=DAOM 197198]
MSETNTPSSTSTSVTSGYDSYTLAYEIRKYSAEELIPFLKEQSKVILDKNDLDILYKEKITGRSLLKMSKDDFLSIGLAFGPARDLAEFAKDCREKKLKSFSTYRTKKDLKEIFEKYNIEDGRITDILQFVPKSQFIGDDNEDLLHCLKDIRLRLRNMGTVVESNEAIRCEYISAILHACINIVRKHTGKEISLNPQLEVVGEENTGRVDFAIRALEELICITEGKQHQITIGFAQNVLQCESAFQTNKRKRKADVAFDEDYDYLFGIVTTATEWHFLLYTPEGIRCTSRNPLNIRFVETALIEDSEDEKELCKNVKRVMEVIVGLLMERVTVEKEPAKKKQRLVILQLTHPSLPRKGALKKLRQRNAEFEAELEAEREEKRISAFSLMEEIDKLKKKNADLFAENFDLKREVAKLREELGNRIEELEKNRADNDAENIKRDAENAELKVRVAKSEQISPAKEVEIDESASLQGQVDDASSDSKGEPPLRGFKMEASEGADSDKIESIQALQAGYEEILSRVHYSDNFKNKVADDKTTRTLIYKEIKRNISPRNPFPRKPHVTSKIADAEAVEYDEPGDDDYNVTLLQRSSDTVLENGNSNACDKKQSREFHGTVLNLRKLIITAVSIATLSQSNHMNHVSELFLMINTIPQVIQNNLNARYP